MAYTLYNEALDPEIRQNPEKFLFAERVDVLQWKISTFADETGEVVPACDLNNKMNSDHPFHRTVVFFNDPAQDLAVSAICDNQPFLYPRNVLDYNLLYMLECRKFETEFAKWTWDAPGMWYNNGAGVTDFWKLARK